jgi:hypothetical protein
LAAGPSLRTLVSFSLSSFLLPKPPHGGRRLRRKSSPPEQVRAASSFLSYSPPSSFLSSQQQGPLSPSSRAGCPLRRRRPSFLLGLHSSARGKPHGTAAACRGRFFAPSPAPSPARVLPNG